MKGRPRRCRASIWTLVAPLALLLCGSAHAEEVGETLGRSLRLPEAPGAHWFWLGDVLLHRTALFDGDSGELLGTITSGTPGVGFVLSPMFSPDHREIYLAESYFSRGVRGERTDVVTVYDGATLEPAAEIPIPPKRGEYFPGVAANAISDDGRFVAVFNVAPATSLSIVDVVGRRFAGEVPTPGCGLVYAAGPRRFFSLCADGALMTVALDDAGAPRSVERTAPFFDPEADPLSEKGARQGSRWLFSTFEGKLHTIDFSGDAPRFLESWPLLGEADRAESWRIGGGQHTTLHRASGRLYVLVHQGGRDTHKQAGTEVWVYDLATRRRVQRIAVENPITSFVRLQAELDRTTWTSRLLSWVLGLALPNLGANGILVTQDERPVLVALSMIPPAVTVYDAMSGVVVREVSEPGISGSLLVAP